MIPYDHETIVTNGVRLHVVQAGPTDGPLTILLHGFPEFWYGWRKQIDALAARGLRVWAPDQRGYNLSEKPSGIGAYNLDALAADVIGLIDAAGRDTAYLGGHDWGAAVAWWTACKYPDRIAKLVILNVPHHNVFRKTVMSDPQQRLKSWYMGFFQIPVLPELIIRSGDTRAFTQALTGTSRRGTFTPEDLFEYRRAWRQPGAITAMLNWYRAVVQRAPAQNPDPRVKMPTRILWGKNDRFLKWEMAQASLGLCDQGEVFYFDEATHWVQHEEPERVNQLIGDFLAPA